MSRIATALQSLRSVNDYASQVQRLPAHLQPLLKHAIPRLNQSASVTFISSDLWCGNEHTELATAVTQKCFHADVQSRRIIGVVQAYGCGKTKTGLRLADSFIVLPIRFNVGSETLVGLLVTEQKRLLDALPRTPTYEQVQAFSEQCLRLVRLCLFALVALYDHCIAAGFLDGSPLDRFRLALLLLTDQQDVVQWCQAFFEQHKATVRDSDAFEQFASTMLHPAAPRQAEIVFLLDEVHVLFNKCLGYCLHAISVPVPSTADAISDWSREQRDGRASAGHRTCTDLFYQFRVVMLNYLLKPVAPFGFVMCSTMLRVWKILQEDNSPLSRGIIDPFFRLHWFTHAEIKHTIRAMFDVQEASLDALEFDVDGSRLPSYKRLSVYGRPLFLMEFLEQLCVTFSAATLPDVSDATIQRWLRKALAASADSTMKRAEDQIATLVTANPAVDMWTARQIVHLLYAAQRLCGGTLELSASLTDEQTLEDIISRGVARLDVKASRFRISDAFVAEALMNRYVSLADKNDAVLKILAQNANLNRALISHDSSQKGFLAERLLAWLAISDQLFVTVLDQQADHSVATWTVSSTADCAGTLPELEHGESSADEPPILVAIMDGSALYVLLPTNLAGPDLWMRAVIDGTVCVVSVQSKVEDLVYSFSKFTSALATLDPIRMYHAAAARAARGKWQPCLAQLQTMSYHRIIFSACGFSTDVQYAVREYNLARGRGVAAGQPRRFIHLLHLDDIGPYAGQVYTILKAQLATPIQESKPVNSFILAHEWRNMSQSRRQRIRLNELKEHCKYRGINVENCQKPQLEAALDQESTPACMTARLNLLDPHFA